MTKIMMRMWLIGLMCCCLENVGRAVPIEVNLVPVDNSAGGPELAGFTTTDIVLTIPDVHTGSQLFIELERGTIYQHPMGTEMVPNPGAVDLVPALAFDTYVAYGSQFGKPFGNYSAFGAAVNIDQRVLPRPLTFDESLIDVAWGPTAGGDLPQNTDGFLAARITLSDDASGQWVYLASTFDEFTVIAPEDNPVFSDDMFVISAGTGVIRSGELRIAARVPEPATIGLVASLFAAGAVIHSMLRLPPRRKTRVRHPG
jgi:hypothetical protein